MSAEPRRKHLTAEEFYALPDHGGHAELVAGEVIEMPPCGGEHGFYGDELYGAIRHHVRAQSLGRMCLPETGFVVARDPDVVRAPDGAFIRSDRVPDPLPPGFVEVMPDLVIEVASPSDRRRAVLDKASEWLDAGVGVVIVVWPTERRVVVFRGATDITTLTEADTLTIEDLLPGFALPVADIFS